MQREQDGLRRLILGAIGVVYGDIGTSPLYALKESFYGHHPLEPTPEHVYGVLSLVVWTLVLVVTVKYLVLVLRADNHGEGGILALTALVRPKEEPAPWTLGWVVVMFGLAGSALLYGDGVITPAISVLSAVEGLELVTDTLAPYVLPITVGVLVALFAVQRRGTAGIGAVFGPVMVAWFLVLAALGVRGIAHHPAILWALGPWHAVRFLVEGGSHAFFTLGSVFLVATGGEALYADMGHFGRAPIRWAWFALVLPALLLNYFGQGAQLLVAPSAHPFFALVPSALVLPVVVLATAATTIASQALISGVFSLTRQAVQLGYLPRMDIVHTSAHEIGQIYIGTVNWALCVACVGLVLGFRSSTNLASAYGIAVVITMVITTMLLAVHAVRAWGWGVPHLLGLGVLALPELGFLLANVLKIGDGGWFPLALGAVTLLALTTWKEGRRLLGQRLREKMPTPEELDLVLARVAPVRVPGAAVFLSTAADRYPPTLMRNLEHNRVLHELVVFLTVTTLEQPHVPLADRVVAHRDERGFWRVTGRYGFMEEPDVPDLLHRAVVHGLQVDTERCTYFLGRETVLPTERPGMALWREAVFSFLARNSQRANVFYRIPPNQVIELGSQVEI